MSGDDGGLFDVRGFIRTIVSAYKEKFHWPLKRDVYAYNLTIGVIVTLLVFVVVMVLLYLWNGRSTSENPRRRAQPQPIILTPQKKAHVPRRAHSAPLSTRSEYLQFHR
jgi:hypothetical protein